MKKILAALLMSAMLTVTACSGQPQGVSESSANSTDSAAYGETAEAGAEKPQRPDISGLTSQEIVSSMTIGWNLGDTLDACQADRDGGGDPQFGAWICNAATDYDGTLARYTNLWTQIADRFQDYDEHLIFESMNEVSFDSLSVPKAYKTLNKLNQAFVDLIRSTGGKNPECHLLIAGYWTDIQKTCNNLFQMPEDPAVRCMVSVHYYTPWDFCTTNIKNEWGTESEQKEMESLIGMMKTNFTDKGIPVIVGEYAASGDDFNSCVFFCEKLVKLCHDYGIATFLWDNGNGQIDRSSNT